MAGYEYTRSNVRKATHNVYLVRHLTQSGLSTGYVPTSLAELGALLGTLTEEAVTALPTLDHDDAGKNFILSNPGNSWIEDLKTDQTGMTSGDIFSIELGASTTADVVGIVDNTHSFAFTGAADDQYLGTRLICKSLGLNGCEILGIAQWINTEDSTEDSPLVHLGPCHDVSIAGGNQETVMASHGVELKVGESVSASLKDMNFSDDSWAYYSQVEDDLVDLYLLDTNGKDGFVFTTSILKRGFSAQGIQEFTIDMTENKSDLDNTFSPFTLTE